MKKFVKFEFSIYGDRDTDKQSEPTETETANVTDVKKQLCKFPLPFYGPHCYNHTYGNMPLI